MLCHPRPRRRRRAIGLLARSPSGSRCRQAQSRTARASKRAPGARYSRRTALPYLELIGHFGSRTYELNEGWATLRREVELRVGPELEAPVTRWKLGRHLNIGVVERQSGFARIVYAEEDLESPDGIVFARFEGWVLEQDGTLMRARNAA